MIKAGTNIRLLNESSYFPVSSPSLTTRERCESSFTASTQHRWTGLPFSLVVLHGLQPTTPPGWAHQVAKRI